MNCGLHQVCWLWKSTFGWRLVSLHWTINSNKTGTSKLEAKTNSQILFNLMTNPISDQHPLFVIIPNCRLFNIQIWGVPTAKDQQKTKLLHINFSKESKNKCKPQKNLCIPPTFCSDGVSDRSCQYLVMLCSASPYFVTFSFVSELKFFAPCFAISFALFNTLMSVTCMNYYTHLSVLYNSFFTKNIKPTRLTRLTPGTKGQHYHTYHYDMLRHLSPP